MFLGTDVHEMGCIDYNTTELLVRLPQKTRQKIVIVRQFLLVFSSLLAPLLSEMAEILVEFWGMVLCD